LANPLQLPALLLRSSESIRREAGVSPVGPLALDLLARATIATIRDDANEIAELYAQLDADQQAKFLILLFGPEI
jgi:hypothetical protein